MGAGMLTRDEIRKGEADPKYRMKLAKSVASDVKPLKRREPRYTPLSKRQDRPDAIAWLLRHHPEVPEQQICKLLGTTKATVQAVRDRTHWKSQEIRPRDPVLLGLCAQLELDDAILRAQMEHGKGGTACRPAGHRPAAAAGLRGRVGRLSRLVGPPVAAAAPVALRQQAAVASRSGRRSGADRRRRRAAACLGSP